MAEIVVRHLSVPAEAEWSFRDSTARWKHHDHGSIATFDPFPAYPHDRATVDAAVAVVSSSCPPVWNVELFIADREEVGRSNGFSNIHEGGHYVDGEWTKDNPTGLIMLSGKRIPPHPAVTRYLVAHEYGHNVEWMIALGRGAKHAHAPEFASEYAKVRGLGDEHLHHGAGGRWHDGVHEVMACDFRILVCEVEAEFWPHHGIARPEDVDGLRGWWAEEVENLAATATAV